MGFFLNSYRFETQIFGNGMFRLSESFRDFLFSDCVRSTDESTFFLKNPKIYCALSVLCVSPWSLYLLHLQVIIAVYNHRTLFPHLPTSSTINIMKNLLNPSAPSETPYTKQSDSKNNNEPTITAEVVNGVTQGQTLYIRKVERTCAHKFSLVVNAIVIISAIGIAIGQIWGMAMKNLGLMEVVMRCYLVAISGMLILNELESVSILSHSPILQKYFWRGVSYTFIGTLGTLLNDVGNDDYYNNWNRYQNNYNNNNGYVTFMIPSLEHALELFIGITSRVLFCMGCVYCVMGLLWVQNKIERDIDEFRDRLHLSEAALAGEQDVIRRRFGGRLGEEIGLA